ncbi:hypothetical protein SAMN04490189_0784 [Pseudomonas koreensis]|uniref:hypothetical protein n=1 Tax=Pseudomonas koreensis TaxID=198620 RepID=UPI00087981D3|nr:hypothetical protein [Pseudomonas koreensis]KAB0510701.1 hypothetical protein F7R05_24195 [Pseudomonas koreensis]NNA59636.1 hypothetical protein [Pseudomonas koreensis]GGK43250.1 hypothetical protein GCM10009103_42350 [Pseudomonas koreensis]SDC87312.1 hypothetical protein SAMN04490189_0784 [Pseudomonas koreensis]
MQEERNYRKLEGMALDFVSGRLQKNASERAIGYSVTFDMDLDFTHFVHMANVLSPGFLNSPVNAIRPELDGFAYHYSYNYLFDAAGNIHDNAALFKLFTPPNYYMDQWAEGAALDVRYAKPVFEVQGNTLRITARRDFRLPGGTEQIEISDLPLMQFRWALNLLENHEKFPEDIAAPATKVVFMYMEEDLVEVDDEQLYRGTRYIHGNQLQFGDIVAKQVLTA